MPDHARPCGGVLAAHDTAGAPVAPAAAAALGLPAGAAADAALAVVTADGVAVRRVPARLVAVAEALPALVRVSAAGHPLWRRPPDSLLAWATAARLALRLVAGHHLLPRLLGPPDGGVRAAWQALPSDDPEVAEALARLAAALPPAAASAATPAGRLWHPRVLVRAFVDAVADTAVRAATPPPARSRPRSRLLPWTARWAEALVDPVDPHVPLRPDEAGELVASVARWSVGEPPADAVTEVRLCPPASDEEPWLLALGVRRGDGRLVPAAELWTDGGFTPAGAAAPDARAALRETLLLGLARTARVFPPLNAALTAARPDTVALTIAQAWRFVSEAEPLLRGSDVVVVLPPELADDHVRLQLRVGAGPGGDARDGAAGRPLDGGITARWEVTAGGEPLDAGALARLASAGTPLVRWQDRWLRVDPAVLSALDRLGDGGRVGFAEAVALGLAGSATLEELPPAVAPAGRAQPAGIAVVEVVADGAVAALLERLQSAAVPAGLADCREPGGFAGELRPYQRRGVAWLRAMRGLGLGAVLADEMGLGKTVQLIAHLLADPDRRPALVVCPTSVVGNWCRELARFAPRLPVTGFHGPDRPADLRGAKGVVVTTYGMLRRDPAPLARVDWSVVALDEAQQVKNPATAGAQAVRQLRRGQTVALTGTPLENRLAELWALLDQTNPGLLGSRAAFERRFALPIERRHDRAAAARLRRLVAPFLLRREKSDPAVVADLPPKIERTVVCPLTPEQAALYREAVARVLDGGWLDGASRQQRRGRVLALLTELKQICNHPAQRADGDPRPLHGRSGKLAVAREIVNEAVDAGERVLVFTQYVRMGHLLVAALADDLGVAVPFLHGGLGTAARDRMVAAFQAGEPRYAEAGGPVPPLLVVSLRAGGTGLNLTAASQVVHYDRWWNPAVEDQATDRAHRIGQRRTVEVHKLVTEGTVEERVDALLERKRGLAEHIVAAGEAWVGQLGDAELRELVTLSAGATVAALDDDWDGDDTPVAATALGRP